MYVSHVNEKCRKWTEEIEVLASKLPYISLNLI